MKRALLFLLVFLITIQALVSQQKVAVLDAALGQEVHPNASLIVADTLNEQFVKSSEFIAIDRAYISSIQKEKEFQLSGEVNEEDIKELGVTFGADYLCVANVSVLGSTYIVSARLIEVETAQVINQESNKKRGTIDILFIIAETVGKKLVSNGHSIATKSETLPRKPETTPKAKEPASEKTESAPRVKQATEEAKTESKAGEVKSHLALGFILPGYMGAENSGGTYQIYQQDQEILDMGFSDVKNTNIGIDLHLMVPINLFYFSLGTSYTNQNLVVADSDSSKEYTWQILSTFDFTGGGGVVHAFSESLQAYAGINLGYMVLRLGDGYSGAATSAYWVQSGAKASGLLLGIELGTDYHWQKFCVNLKYKLSYSPSLSGEEIFTDAWNDTSFGIHGLAIGIGIGF
jgi:TolB-like protein